MFSSEPADEKQILKSVLAPLLDDFLYWFELSLGALEKHRLGFMSEAEQTDLMARIRQAQGEVTATKSLFQAMDGNAGVDVKVLMPWHQLVSECWQVAQKRRQWEAES
ncbi:hypothetical protein NIES970_15100 [[Synechococcus] sp. NIES-970]|uniref:DUF2605 domain-containing protein n=1 Tax=Picosynechococcus sp. NKBG15041c TaxID=1407650 RepID=UPI0003F7AAAB|nr:DUF2605 domain-containing protein [Picosynechococcus sp. NKBG15041c]BAW96577.1 hypothetical protein NIES970_15100 [[Synechococcus] sp. NIES-970]